MTSQPIERFERVLKRSVQAAEPSRPTRDNGATPPKPVRDPAPAPDYVPARMLNEVIYCPRLFYYEYVEGIFVENRETVEGSQAHKRVDAQ